MKTIIDRLNQLIEIKESVDQALSLTKDFEITSYAILLKSSSRSLNDAIGDMQKVVNESNKILTGLQYGETKP